MVHLMKYTRSNYKPGPAREQNTVGDENLDTNHVSALRILPT